MEFEFVPPEDIRGEKNVFQLMIINAMNRIHQQTFASVASHTWKDMRALEASIRILHAFVAPYYDEEYKNKVAEVEKKLLVFQEWDKSMKKIKVLQSWIELMVERFSEFQILPPITVAWKSGEGPLKKGEKL